MLGLMVALCALIVAVPAAAQVEQSTVARADANAPSIASPDERPAPNAAGVIFPNLQFFGDGTARCGGLDHHVGTAPFSTLSDGDRVE